MDGVRALVVFYSWSGPTSLVARRIARLAGADVEELVDCRNHGGIGGLLRMGLGATLGLEPDLAPTKHDPSEYDVVILGTPILGAHISAPMRAYLLANHVRMERVAFFCTQTNGGSAQPLREMEGLCGKAPLVSLALRKPDIESGNYELKARCFVGELQRRLTTGSSPPPPSHPLRSTAAVA